MQLWFDFQDIAVTPPLALPKHISTIDLDIAKQGCFFASSTSLTVGICWSFYWRQCWLRKWFSFTSNYGSRLAERPGGGSSDKQAVWPGDRLSWQHDWLVHCFALLGHTPEWQSKQNSWNVETEQAEFALALHHDSSFPGWINFHFFINGEQSKNRENPPFDYKLLTLLTLLRYAIKEKSTIRFTELIPWIQFWHQSFRL